jgi:phospholipid/cholesterol/gamma-HCH transport system permease protein
MLKKLFTAIGEYFLLLGKVLSKPQKRNVYLKLLVREFYDLGVNSFGLVLFTSFFVGAVVAIQMYNNFSASSFPIPNSFI